MPVKPEQDILNEGPGLRQRARETKAVTDAVTPPATGTVSAAAHYAPSVMDRIAPKAKYGSKPGEKRIDVKEMTKPLSSYKKGTAYVPETGPAMLHKGEAVIPAKENMATPYDMITEGKKPEKKIKEVRTRKAKSGGFIHEHHHTEPAHHPMEEHTTPDMKGMLAHMAEHMGPENEGASEQAGESSAAEAQEKALGM